MLVSRRVVCVAIESSGKSLGRSIGEGCFCVGRGVF